MAAENIAKSIDVDIGVSSGFSPYHYCGLADAPHWVEIINAVTYGFCMVVALLLYALIKRSGQGDLRAYTLALTVFAIGFTGFASNIFHSFTFYPFYLPWPDLPLFLFYHALFVLFFSRDVMLKGVKPLGIMAAVFITSSLLLGYFTMTILSGALAIIPALLYLWWFSAWVFKFLPIGRRTLINALILLLTAMILRSMNGLVCGIVPLGTYFLWSILSAMSLYLTTRAYLLGRSLNFQPPTPPEKKSQT